VTRATTDEMGPIAGGRRKAGAIAVTERPGRKRTFETYVETTLPAWFRTENVTRADGAHQRFAGLLIRALAATHVLRRTNALPCTVTWTRAPSAWKRVVGEVSSAVRVIAFTPRIIDVPKSTLTIEPGHLMCLGWRRLRR
jgi:hypothetical protein